MPPPLVIPVGTRLGRLVVTGPGPLKVTKSGKTRTQVYCDCDCGTRDRLIVSSYLVAKTQPTRSCGCLQVEATRLAGQARVIDLTGQRFRSLVVIERGPKRTKATDAHWRCLCDCGDEVIVAASDLTGGDTGSCGCGRYRAHGLSGTREYNLMHAHLRRARKMSQEYDTGITLARVIERDGPLCQYCGFDTTGYTHPHPCSPQIDHVVPLSRGGTHTWSSVRVLCKRCNQAKASKLDDEVLAEDHRRYPRFPALLRTYLQKQAECHTNAQ